MISLIAAIGKNRVIGNKGALPWRLSGDLKFFKATTLGKPVIMGRKTYESIGRPLPGRPNIIISRDKRLKIRQSDCRPSLESAIACASTHAAKLGVEEIMIIGGAQIYRAAMKMADRLYITEVALSPEGDAYFPEYSARDWIEIHRESVTNPAQDSPDFAFVTLDRRTDRPAHRLET